MSDTQCPICSGELTTDPNRSQKFDALIYDCPQCGKYELDELSPVNQEPQDLKQLISAWIRIQNRHGKIPYISHYYLEEDWFKNIHNMGIPQTVNEKLDGLLKAYADIVQDDYGKVVDPTHHPTLISDIAAKNMSVILGLNRLLSELDYIWEDPNARNNLISIKAKGWQRIDDLTKPSYSSDSVFIAMWYDPTLAKYRESVKKAIDECGYKPIIIDDVNFNDFIMDQVIQYIRQARFLIADLTCIPEEDNKTDPRVSGGVRGGVYWESGMAYGLGKTVIQTCRDDDCSKKRIHFDLNQYKTIFWKQEELTTDIRPLSSPISDPTFTERLAQRILATVGKGNYFTPG